MNSGRCVLIVVAGLSILPGCTWAWKSPRLAQLEKDRQDLRGELARLQEDFKRMQDERAHEVERLMREKELATRQAVQEKGRQSDELLQAERDLTESLQKELGEARARLTMTERGLVLTFLDEIFFDSGKSVIKPEGATTLEKVARVLRETVPDSPVAVEGHTDNEPIKYSGWRSNWELSASRGLAVVHSFVNEHSVSPERVRAVAFGEFQPVSSNDTPEGRRQNRRVEIVILPKTLTKIKE